LAIDYSQLAELRNFFSGKVLTGDTLPNLKSVDDKTFFIDTVTLKLYISLNGKWYLVTTLTEA